MAEKIDEESSESDSADEFSSSGEDENVQRRSPELDGIINTICELIEENKQDEANKRTLDTYERLKSSYNSENDRQYLDYSYYLELCSKKFREDISKEAVRIQIMADLHQQKTGGSEYNLAYVCIHRSLLETFQTLLQNHQATQDRSNPESVPVLETWAMALKREGKLDAALKKTKDAMSFVKNSKRKEDIKRTHTNHSRRRPKSRLPLIASIIEDLNWGLKDTGTKPIPEPRWFHCKSERKKKERRKTRRLRQSKQVIENSVPSEVDEQISIENEYDEEEDKEFDSELPVKSFFDESVKLLCNETVGGSNEHDFILNDMDLSDSFVESLIKRNERKTVYNENLPIQELQILLKSQPKWYKRCTLQIQSAHESVCSLIKPERNLTEIKISGRSRCGKNFTEDEVVVKIISNSSPQTKMSDHKETATYGQVVGRLKRNRYAEFKHPVIVCELDHNEYHKMRPLNKVVPKIHLYKNNRKNRREENLFQIDVFNYDAKSKNLQFKKSFEINPAKKLSYAFLVVYLSWDDVYPLGAVIKVIETDSKLSSGLHLLEIKHQVPTKYRPNTVKDVQCLIEEKKQGKVELKDEGSASIHVFTIDPEHSKDLDDALSVETLQTGEFEVGIHISDVANYVRKGDSIDEEARIRAMSFYQGQGKQSYHMLPEPLSQNHCSLLPDEHRRALSTFFRFSPDGVLKDGPPNIKKTWVKSGRRFTYEDVHHVLRNDNDCNIFSSEIRTLHKISKNLRSSRLGDSKISKDFVRVDDKDLDSAFDDQEAHNLVEEFMILTNKTVAQFVCSKFPNFAILRCHDVPTKERVQKWLRKYPLISNLIMRLQNTEIPNLQQTLGMLSIKKKDLNTPIKIQQWVWSFLEQCANEKNFRKACEIAGCDDLHPEQALALREWKSFQEEAKYKCHEASKNRGKSYHFALRIPDYIHFTSPIRRYADLVNHRFVHAALDNEKDPPYKRSEIEDICLHLNQVSKRKNLFEQQCKALIDGHSLRKNPTVCNGYIEETATDKITLFFPEKKSMTERNKEIHLKLLRVSCQPEIRNDILSLTWHKRIYSQKEVERLIINSRDVRRIDPHQRVSFQQLSRWRDVLKACVDQDSNKFENKMSVNACYNKNEKIRKSVPTCTKTESDVSCENMEGALLSNSCKFSMSFSHAQILTVQFGADTNKGVLEPSPQILELTNNVKFCLMHTKDPVKYLAEYATKAADRRKCDTVEAYCETWLPLLRMEAVTTAVRTDSTTITDVPIELHDDGGTFNLSIAFCEDRHIEFSNASVIENLLNEESRENSNAHKEFFASSDFLCFKCSYDVSTPFPKGHPERRRIWIAHGHVETVRKIKEHDILEIRFQLHPSSSRPPRHIRNARDKPNCNVEILTNPVSIRRQEEVLQCLKTANSLAKEIALGKDIPPLNDEQMKSTDVEVDGLALNNEQQNKAILASLSQQFTLIQGPPGTGKTNTCVKLLYLFTQINRKNTHESNALKQIVVCGPSNKSVDHIAKMTIEKLGEKRPKLIRMYASAFECCDYAIPGKAHSTGQDKQPDKSLKGISLHHLIRNNDKPSAKKIREFDAYCRKVRDLSTIKNAKEAVEFKAKMKEFKALKNHAKVEEIRQCEVIFCTTAMTTNPTFIRATKNNIRQCIIDESAMCTEPDCLAAIITTQPQQVVLIGDHKQLRPVIMCNDAILGLEKSLFERYAKEAIILNRQYRMHPSICELVSSQFYGGDLETVLPSERKVQPSLRLWKDPQYPYIFLHVEGEEEYLSVSTEEGNENSCRNQMEVEKVVYIFNQMVKSERVPPDDINIMSQYRAQCNTIKKSLEKSRILNFNVNTVVSSQGGEWDYVIFSTTRSLPDFKIEPKPTLGWQIKNLGFISDEHQINVALSRARKGLVIIGNKNLLKVNKVWGKLLKIFEKNGCVI
ncbi:helicase with zinc finger domain 2-like [Ylistrum balloti]|uniref:helicase with zinc finger domain 2-like n=1 Tax=Ylistrum balloti TaxID=509963 RepID=UPI002905DAB7|nr:helicase with zinc finger domain 2-like [Ylistrum balloti]